MIILATVAFGNERSSSVGAPPPECPSRSDITIGERLDVNKKEDRHQWARMFRVDPFATQLSISVTCRMKFQRIFFGQLVTYNFTMTVPDALRKPAKRKQVDEEDVSPEDLQATGSLEMLSDEEDAGDTSSDDGQVDEFPEIVDESDSDESDFEEDDDDEGQEDDEHDDEGAESDDSLHIFPKAKVVVSEITHQPKTVYPEIEPDYDSDSSTEEVRNP